MACRAASLDKSRASWIGASERGSEASEGTATPGLDKADARCQAMPAGRCNLESIVVECARERQGSPLNRPSLLIKKWKSRSQHGKPI